MKNSSISKRLSRTLALLPLLWLWATAALAQSPAADQPEMADVLRQNGKIYVVVLVVVIIVSGLLLYLVRLDRKVSRLEQEIGE